MCLETEHVEQSEINLSVKFKESTSWMQNLHEHVTTFPYSS
jgi:hypothetical protein